MSVRLSKAAKEFNVGMSTIIEFLAKKGFKIDSSPNTKLNGEMYALIVKEYHSEKEVKKNAEQFGGFSYKGKTISVEETIKKYNDEEDDFEIEEDSTIRIKTSMPEDVIAKKDEPKLQDAKTVDKQEETTQKAEQKTQEIKNDDIAIEKKQAKEETVVNTIVETEKETTKEKEAPVKQEITENKNDIKSEEKAEIIPSETNIVEKKDIISDKDDKKISGGGIQLTVVGKIPLEDKKSKDKKDNKDNKNNKNNKQNQNVAKPQNNKQQPDKHNVKPQQQNNKPENKNIQQANKNVSTNNDQSQNTTQNSDKEQQNKEAKPINFIPTQVKKLEGPKILDKIELPTERKHKSKQPVASSGDDKVGSNINGNKDKDKKKKRKRINNDGNANASVNNANNNANNKGKDNRDKQAGAKANDEKREKRKNDKFKKSKAPEPKVELTEEEIQKQIKETLARLSPLGKSKTSKHRREKRQFIANELEEERLHEQEEKRILKVTEFVTANELATMMNIPVTKVISTCMSVGVFVSINQRLDAEILTVVAEEFGFKVEFISIDVQEALANKEEEDRPEDLVPRAPIVTVMGHVDHGKTKLLDFIRQSNVAAGEAGGITQHIGAYEVTTASGKKISFLDTPGHEAFTAMRARGASLTDVAIIVIAADDSVMPQTIEAINHAQAANVPIVFAINKIDKPTANPQKIYQELAQMNILVEEWGGKYQSQEISAKQGLNVDKLLDKVLLEAEFLDLQANPKKAARGAIIESALDKGRGYVAKIMVQDGTLKVGDMVLAGTTYGKVKAMFNEQNASVKSAGPSTPVLLLGLNGAPQAGDNFNVLNDEKEVKSIVSRRQQLQREQGLRTQKHITLDEIGRRIAIGDFKELNIIVKADVDGSVEALSDSLLKLSTQEVQVNVIHKSVGAISESDIMLASASNAVIVGFNVRPTMQARRLAEREEIDIRLYSIIYTAIEEIKSAIEGMLAPEIEEVVTCNIEIREVFNISKVGRIAGCMVLDGKVNRQTKIRIIRDGIVVHTGSLGSLKRYKDDVKEVSAGYECGLNIDGYNDIKPGDIIEGYTIKEISRKLN
ncbi:MAG: translation initiation factor IF-2 [Lentimicrobiaceae bacterium]|nr:translation initiation factor IF-2 [Lentimicrobiaceae bacterium]